MSIGRTIKRPGTLFSRTGSAEKLAVIKQARRQTLCSVYDDIPPSITSTDAVNKGALR